MAVHDEDEWQRDAAAIPQMRYARLWQSVVSGSVPPRATDVERWYRAAQHVLGPLLHDAQVERILEDGDGRPHCDRE